MADNYAIVVTTINEPTRPVIEIRDRAADLSAKFFVVGDTRSPATFELDGSEWLSIETQKRLPYKYAALCPTKHYARKNIGYLAAIADGANVIIETDDDNFPTQQFWEPRQRYSDGRLVERHGWCNAYSYFSEDLIWPRGLPLNHIQDSKAPVSLSRAFLDCPIQQGLADENPDVDAIYRLVFPLPKNFHGGQNLILGSNVWCPFNSQNTTFWKEAFPLLYLPYYCSFRMTDIWRSFVAQRLAWECGWHILFQQATVYQERNPHDLMIDFVDEISGYKFNEKIGECLTSLVLKPGVEQISENLMTAYEALISLGVLSPQELPLLEAWIDDLVTLG